MRVNLDEQFPRDLKINIWP